MAQPVYRVLVYAADPANGFGYGNLIAEFDRFHALGYADYVNSVPEAFFTLMQDDPKITLLRGRGGKAHVRIYRDDSLVWTGAALLEHDANGNDAVFYCYGYVGELFWLLSDFPSEWTSQTLGFIAERVWTRATVHITSSRLAFVTEGTIQDPPTVAGGSTPITLPTYKAYYKRLLFVLQELAALGSSDTGNNVAFEITHSTTPTFNFWTDLGASLEDTVKWEYGGGIVQSFRELSMPVTFRNDVRAVGQQPRDSLLRKTVEDPDGSITSRGRMMEPLFFAWVRDEEELTRATNLRALRGKREDLYLSFSFFPGAEVPPLGAGYRFNKGTRIHAIVDRGVTNIDATMQVSGYQVAVLGGVEKVNVLLSEPVGPSTA